MNHAIDDYAIQEARERRQHLDQLSTHPDCRDPDHPGCSFCDYAHDIPEGHITLDEFIAKRKAELDRFAAEHSHIESDDEIAWHIAETDWLCTLGSDT